MPVFFIFIVKFIFIGLFFENYWYDFLVFIMTFLFRTYKSQTCTYLLIEHNIIIMIKFYFISFKSVYLQATVSRYRRNQAGLGCIYISTHSISCSRISWELVTEKYRVSWESIDGRPIIHTSVVFMLSVVR